jgi:hypothetical protein
LIKRKGVDRLIEAFLAAFDGREDVVLVLKTTRTDYDEPASRWRRLLARRSGKDWRRGRRRVGLHRCFC